MTEYNDVLTILQISKQFKIDLTETYPTWSTSTTQP